MVMTTAIDTQNGNGYCLQCTSCCCLQEATHSQQLPTTSAIVDGSKNIRQEYTRPKSVRTAGHLGFSGSLALPMTNLATPLQNMERRLAVERRAAIDGGADVVALQAVKAIGPSLGSGFGIFWT